MTPRSFRLAISTAAIACLLPWIAQAEYRCNPPPTPLDRRACNAAAESPAALRQYIQRVQPIRNLRFDDYVSDATVVVWEAAMAREREAKLKAKNSSLTAASKSEPR